MPDSNNFIEATLYVPRIVSDAVCNFIIENISGGLIVEDEEDGADIGIKFYVPEKDNGGYKQKLKFYINSLQDIHPDLEFDIDIKERTIENIEWEEAYKESLKPVVVADDIVVRPPWDDPPPEMKYDIIIEPKMAFGTGTHETTRGCLKAIRENFEPANRFLDLGCGSGVLSVLASQMRASYIKAIDYDPISVDNSHENFLINKVTVSHDILLGSIDLCLNDQPYDFVCANIIKVTILEMIDELDSLTRKGGVLVLSGLLDIDEDEIITQLERLALTDFSILKDNEWRTFIIYK